MKRLTWLLIVLVMPCFSQANQSQQTVGSGTQQTLGELNGRFWQVIPSSQKATFIVGFAEGMGFARPEQVKDFPTVPYGDIVQGLDRFYGEAEKLVFPVGYALQIFTMKLNGATQSEIDKKLIEYRTFIRDVEGGLKRLRQ